MHAHGLVKIASHFFNKNAITPELKSSCLNPQ